MPLTHSKAFYHNHTSHCNNNHNFNAIRLGLYGRLIRMNEHLGETVYLVSVSHNTGVHVIM